MRWTIAFSLACACACAQDNAKPFWTKPFWISEAVSGAASGFDYATSVRLNGAAKKGWVREQNGLLRNAYGGFDAVKGAEYKLGTNAAALGAELWIRHRYGRSARSAKTVDRWFTMVNFASSGIFWRAGIHNLRLAPSR